MKVDRTEFQLFLLLLLKVVCALSSRLEEICSHRARACNLSRLGADQVHRHLLHNDVLPGMSNDRLSRTFSKKWYRGQSGFLLLEVEKLFDLLCDTPNVDKSIESVLLSAANMCLRILYPCLRTRCVLESISIAKWLLSVIFNAMLQNHVRKLLATKQGASLGYYDTSRNASLYIACIPTVYTRQVLEIYNRLKLNQVE